MNILILSYSSFLTRETQSGLEIKALPMATKSYSSSYNRSRRPEISVGLDSFPLKVSIKSSVKPIPVSYTHLRAHET